MKISKLLLTGLIAVAAATFTSACRLFEDSSDEEVSQFYDAGAKDAKGLNGKNGSFNPNDPEFGKAGNGFGNGPGAYADGPVGAMPYADGVGARIQGVNFEPVYFMFDQNAVARSEEFKIEAVAEYLLAHPNAGVVIEGNCDERGTAEYNRSLGERRALAAKTILLEFGIADSRIKTISYGKERPAVQGADDAAFAKNRRDDFVPVYLLKK